VRRLDSLSANTRKLSNSAPIEAVSAGRVRSKRRAGFDDSGAAVEVENADLGFIDNNNLGDSLVAIRGEANDLTLLPLEAAGFWLHEGKSNVRIKSEFWRGTGKFSQYCIRDRNLSQLRREVTTCSGILHRSLAML
jgi:hypothetical protein